MAVEEEEEQEHLEIDAQLPEPEVVAAALSSKFRFLRIFSRNFF
jgi:hypothetical protein